jgi:hypothetical protein
MDMEFTEEYIEQRMQFAESIFMSLGAECLEINEKNREKFGQRKIYKYNSKYYRVGRLEFEEEDEKPFIVLSCTDNEKYAEIGLLEDVDAFEADLSDKSVESKIKDFLENN